MPATVMTLDFLDTLSWPFTLYARWMGCSSVPVGQQ